MKHTIENTVVLTAYTVRGKIYVISKEEFDKFLKAYNNCREEYNKLENMFSSKILPLNDWYDEISEQKDWNSFHAMEVTLVITPKAFYEEQIEKYLSLDIPGQYRLYDWCAWCFYSMSVVDNKLTIVLCNSDITFSQLTSFILQL